VVKLVSVHPRRGWRGQAVQCAVVQGMGLRRRPAHPDLGVDRFVTPWS